ncbi:hypothetical protein GCM10010392_67740 [Streptomyces clavifer]|nr:hypothetical protein GCM10010392_67740 [Streptomyces clavifer]
MGVDGGGDANVGVAEEFLDHDEFDALFQEQGGGRVPEVVEADAAEAGLALLAKLRSVSSRRAEYSRHAGTEPTCVAEFVRGSRTV